MKHKHALYPIFMSICAFLCFLVVVLLMSGVVQPLFWKTMVLLFPSIILFTVGIFALTGKLNKNKTVAVTTVLSALLLTASVIYFFVLLMWTATTETTDIRYYERAYNVIKDEDGVEKVFPRTVPTEAKDITFYYIPQFLQGGEVFELTYKATEEQLKEWKTFLTKEAEWIGSNKEWHETNHWGFYGDDSVRYHLDWDGGSNHGEICYVLIDEDLNRITFYYSEW